mgnify:CR=1 FL=1
MKRFDLIQNIISLSLISTVLFTPLLPSHWKAKTPQAESERDHVWLPQGALPLRADLHGSRALESSV